jgi:CubicO group peptidase (beta-lactamase class C family)
MKQKTTFVILFSTILSLLLASCSTSSIFQAPTPTPTPLSLTAGLVIEPGAIDRLDARLAQMTQDGTFTGSVLIAVDEKILLSKGYGMADRAKGTPNTPQTRFHLGSTTKMFTGMGILILQSQGKLSVQDPICNFFDDCPKEWQDITIHHLLTFTSGLSAQLSDQLYREIERGPSGPITASEKAHYLGLSSQWTLDTPPGEQYAYNNFGYILLAHIIEEVSGQSYGDYLKQAIFTPLKMHNTGYPDGSGEEIAIVYHDGLARTGGKVRPLPVSDGAGGLYSSSEDLFLWDQAFYTGQLLPQSELDRMLKTYLSQADTADLGYGTSWFTAGGGEGSYFATFIVQVPQIRLTVNVLMNQMIDMFDIWDLIKSELF